MALFSPFTTTSTTISTTFFCPFFNKTTTFSTNRKQKCHKVISCKAEANNGEQDNSSNPSSKESQADASPGKLDRRNILIGLGGLYGATTTPSAFADPITSSSPDVTKLFGPGPLTLPYKVCLPSMPPKSSCIIDFELPSQSSPLRIRPAAHLASEEYIAKYKEAVRRMKCLPDDHPHSFLMQANIHDAYCNGVYNEVGFPDIDTVIHGSWLFLPFHRWYLYFYEKILGKLIGDPTFALPFWNWDSPHGMKMPAIYDDPYSPLYDRFRNQNHRPPTMVDLNWSPDEDEIPSGDYDQLSSNNLHIMHKKVARVKSARLFHGEPYHDYRPCDEDFKSCYGSLEVPHNCVHSWCGDNREVEDPKRKDMGNLGTAGRDPMFFAHHSNVDRMWTIWKTILGRKDFTDPDWLNSGFLFYDENEQLVRVKVRDCLDNKMLRYDYQQVYIPWLLPPRYRSRTPRKSLKAKMKFSGVAEPQNEMRKRVDHFPITLNQPISTVIRRHKKSRTRKQKDEEEEVLVIEGIVFDKNKEVKFDVYINDYDDPIIRPDEIEFAGSFINVPHSHKQKMNSCFSLCINELLEELEADDDDSIMVTLVPRSGKGLVTIGGIKIEFFGLDG